MKSMFAKEFKRQAWFATAIVLALGLSLSLQSLVQAWTGPTAAPPGGNISAPVYTGGSGVPADAQTRYGNLSITGDDAITDNPALTVNEADPDDPSILRIRDAAENAELQLEYGDGPGDHWSLYTEQEDDSFRFWGGGANRLAVLQNGNVGIGEDNPSRLLTINAGSAFNQGLLIKTDDRTLRLAANLQDGSFNPISRAGDRGIFYGGASNNDGNYGSFVIAPWRSDIGESGIRMNGAGSVGINKAAPGRSLEVSYGGQYSGIRIRNTGSSGGFFDILTSDDTGYVPGGLTFYDGVNGQHRLTILANGRVGIGNPAPTVKLDVAGAIKATGDICTDQGGGKCLSTAGGGAAEVAGDRNYYMASHPFGGLLSDTPATTAWTTVRRLRLVDSGQFRLYLGYVMDVNNYWIELQILKNGSVIAGPYNYRGTGGNDSWVYQTIDISGVPGDIFILQTRNDVTSFSGQFRLWLRGANLTGDIDYDY